MNWAKRHVNRTNKRKATIERMRKAYKHKASGKMFRLNRAGLEYAVELLDNDYGDWRDIWHMIASTRLDMIEEA